MATSLRRLWRRGCAPRRRRLLIEQFESRLPLAVVAQRVANVDGLSSYAHPHPILDAGNGTAYFAGWNSYPSGVWKTDATAVGTVRIADFDAGPNWDFEVVGSTLFFVHNDRVHGLELWKTDGTVTGTKMLKDIEPGPGGSQPNNLTNVNGKLMFMARGSLWKSDGTSEGTVLVKAGGSSGDGHVLTNVSGTLFYHADAGNSSSFTFGTQLWKSDGTTAGTVLVKNFAGTGNTFRGSQGDDFFNLNGKLLFRTKTGTSSGYNLWKSDGTSAGTILLKSFSGDYGDKPADWTEVNGTAFFTAKKGLWKTDGTPEGTVQVGTVKTDPGYGANHVMANVNGALFFPGYNGTTGPELWKSDGTMAGTVLIRDIDPTGCCIGPRWMVNWNGKLVFGAWTPATGVEPWISDGTAAGTRMLTEIYPGREDGVTREFVLFNGMLLFGGRDAVHGSEVWKIVDVPSHPPANTPPSATDGTVTAWENATYVFQPGDFRFQDDGDTPPHHLAAVKINSLPAGGSLKLNNSDVTAGQTVAAFDVANGKLRYTPDTDKNGPAYASFTFQVQDDGGTAGGGSDWATTANTLTINVTPVNSAPSGGDGAVTALEDVPYSFAASNFGFSDSNDFPANVLAGIKIASLPSVGSLTLGGTPASVGQMVAVSDIVAGNLQFLAAANTYRLAYAGFSFQVFDSGGTVGGGVELDPTPNTVSIDVLPVNDPPSGSDRVLKTFPRAPYAFFLSDFGFTDQSDTPAHGLAAVKIVTVATSEHLTNNGQPVTEGQVVSFGDIAAGRFQFLPPDGQSLPNPTFTFQAQDDGGVVNGGIDLDPTPNTITLFNYQPPPEAPSGIDRTITTAEDVAYTFRITDFPFSDVNTFDTLRAVRITTLPTQGELRSSGSLVSAGQFVSAYEIALGRFLYVPPRNANGIPLTTFGFQVQDDGFINLGGSNIDPSPNTMTIEVTAVNDAPVGTTDVLVAGTSYGGTWVNFYTLLANDFDVEGEKLSVVSWTKPTYGYLSPNGTRELSYSGSPPAGTLDSFTYLVSDGTSNSSPVTVYLTNGNGAYAVNDSFHFTPGVILTIAPPGVLNNDLALSSGATATLVVQPPAAEGTVNLAANGGFVFTPAAGFSGKTIFTYRASGTAVEATVTISGGVNHPPQAQHEAFTTTEDSTFPVQPVSISFFKSVLANDADTDGDSLASSVAVPPQYGTLNLRPNGTFTYVPAANFSGTDYFTYTLSDGTLTDIGTVAIGVAPVNDAPSAVGESYTTTEDAALTVAGPALLVNDTDLDGDALSAWSVGRPAHGTLSFSQDGGFVYTPDADYSGTDSFSYQASDGRASSNLVTVSLTVTAVGDAPRPANDRFTALAEQTLAIPAPGVQTNDLDADGDTLSAMILQLPAHGSATLAADGSFVYTPTSGYTGNDSFTYRVTDPGGAVSDATVSINVILGNIVANDDRYVTAEDTRLAIAAPGVLANDQRGLGAVIDRPPLHGKLELSFSGSLTYVPDLDYYGADSFTYRVSDGVRLSAPATVSISITPVNDPPVATGETFTFDWYDWPNLSKPGVLANDRDPDGDMLRAVLVTAPSFFGFHLLADGSFAYQPKSGYSGPSYSTFTYRVTDGLLWSDPVTTTIQSYPDSGAPVETFDLYYTATRYSGLSVPAPGLLASNDGKGTAYVTSSPYYGYLDVKQDGSFTYTPHFYSSSANYDSFSFQIWGDTSGRTYSYRVRIQIADSNQAPTTVDDYYTVLQDNPLVLRDRYQGDITAYLTTNDREPNGDTMFVSLVSSPAHGTVTLAGYGGVTYVPEAGYHGPDSFTYRARDGALAGNVATVFLNVVAKNDPPAASNDIFYFTEDHGGDPYYADVLINDLSPDRRDLFALVETQPTHGWLWLAPSGRITYVPHSEYYGDDFFTYRAATLSGKSQPATVTLRVLPWIDAPLPIDDGPYITPQDTPLTIPAPGILANDVSLDGGTLTASLSYGSRPAHGTVSLNAKGSFTYTPDSNYSGPDSFTYEASSAPYTWSRRSGSVSIYVADINRAPAGTSVTRLIPGSDSVTLAAGDFGFSDPGDAPAHRFAGVKVVAQLAGTLLIGAVPVLPDQLVSIVDINAGRLRLVPQLNGVGTSQAAFTFQVQDDGRTVFGGVDLDPSLKFFAININLVNQPPSFVRGADLTVTDESGPQSITAWATSISYGATDLGQTLQFVVLGNTKPELFAVPPAIDAVGKLTFTPRPNMSGIAEITIQLKDNGGTAHGGSDMSEPQKFSVSVTKPHSLHNALNRLDVTGNGILPDGAITAADALAIVNYINAFGPGPIAPDAASGPPFLDTTGGPHGTGDNFITASDALAVINYINSFGEHAVATGEGESRATQTAASTPMELDLLDLLAMDWHLQGDAGKSAAKRRPL